MRRIVVGVDGSTDADAALRWAVAEAGLHDATLAAVLAWSYLDQHHTRKEEGFDPNYGEEDARRDPAGRAGTGPGP